MKKILIDKFLQVIIIITMFLLFFSLAFFTGLLSGCQVYELEINPSIARVKNLVADTGTWDSYFTIDYDTVEFDTDGYFNIANPQRLTIPIGNGDNVYYQVTAHGYVDIGAVMQRNFHIIKIDQFNSSDVQIDWVVRQDETTVAGLSNPTYLNISAVIIADEGDYFTVSWYIDKGSNPTSPLAKDQHFSIFKIR